MAQVKKIADFIQNYWLLIGLFCTGLGSVIGFTHNYIIMPEIHKVIDNRIMIMANDSLADMIDDHLTEKGGGFRGTLSDSTGLSKQQVVKVLADMIGEESTIKGDVMKLQDEVDYQHGYNFFLLKNIAEKSTYNGVTYWRPYDGNTYYQDMYGLVWDAKYDAYDDCYYFYPNYSNGNRLKCE